MIVTPGFRRRALVVALTGIYGMGSQLAQANPTGAQVVNGQAVLQAQGNKLTVTNTPGAIINWQSFSIGAGETTYFLQQNAASAVLNRVQAQNPALKSQIDGALGSNGRVFLINPNGIVFGAGSVIDTQGFVASTLNLNDADFKAGKLKFSSQAAAAGIEAKGRISSGSGDVYLVAPNIGVDGNAVITTQGGNIVLAAGEAVEITGRNLNDITFSVQSKDNQVINLGTLSGGAVGVFAGTLSHSGLIQAQSLANEGGRLVLKAQGNVTLAAGSKTLADGNTLGGSIGIESQTGNVILDTGALVSAKALSPGSSSQGVSRGGDVTIDAAAGVAAIERDASVVVDGGRGGSVVLRSARLLQDGGIHADGQTTFGGSISLQAGTRMVQTGSAVVSARGVLKGGDITLSVDATPSGSGNLFSSATVDASASSGLGGSITVSGRDLSFAGARLVANGDAGGGSLRVGGGLGGLESSMPNARNVTANAASSFEASARIDGDGGKVVLWADGINKTAGVLEARGGASGGNGGFIEVSGKEETQFGGTPNASAPHGLAGTFKLDPKYILIQAPVLVPGVSVELIDPNPGINDAFGQNLLTLANGNIVVFNSQDDLFGTNSGAVYLYNGVTGALISNLHGSAATDRVGSGLNVSSFAPSSGAILVSSPLWNGSAGAFTYLDPVNGLSGAVSAANSFVGSVAGDQIGSGGLQFIGGKVAIRSPQWNGGAGAITWADGSTFITGTVSGANSLIGGAAGDHVGANSLVFQSSSNLYTLYTPAWNGNAGALSWIDIAAPLTGFINSGNSLVGSAPGDQLGSGSSGLFRMQQSGSYLVLTPNFNSGAGAVTWVSSTGAATGTIGSETNANSIFGSAPNEGVGSGGIGTGVVFLDYNYGSFYQYGNFVVVSPNALGGVLNGMGAVTFGTQAGGFGSSAAVSSGNSLVGSLAGDHVGSGGITRLSNNSFLISSPQFNTDSNGNYAGAVTWANGSGAISGTIDGSTTNGNSVYGNAPGDFVGSDGIVILGTGNFVVVSPDATSVNSPGQAGVGAVSFGTQASGFTPTPGYGINVSNSLVGTTAGDHVGSGGVVALSNGNYVVLSPQWSNTSTASQVGAVTWGSGTSGVAGGVNAVAGSLIGDNPSDRIGSDGIQEVGFSGNYVIMSSHYNSDGGAVTFAPGSSSMSGTVAANNSIYGAPGDGIGSQGVTGLGNGNFLVFSPDYVNTNAASVSNAGAVTWGSGSTGFAQPGLVSSSNSLVGTHTGDNVGDNPGANLYDFYDYYVLRSPDWNGDRSALTFSTGTTEIKGDINSTSNSLVGSFSGDNLGSGGILYLPTTGNYLVLSPDYKTSSSAKTGAVTWGSSANTLFGTIGSETHGNSIYGSVPGDAIGSGGVVFLDYNNYNSNYGNFVVVSPDAGNPTLSLANAGAVTFGNPTTGFGTSGVVSSSNSLIGDHTGDHLGNGGITRLHNPSNASLSNYLVLSPFYNSDSFGAHSGAVTWASGTVANTGVIGAETHGNSVYGNNSTDGFSSGGIQFLDYNYYYANYGNFVVLSPNVLGGKGAVTFGTESSGFASPGFVSSANSLVGANAGDQIGIDGIERLYNPSDTSHSNYLIYSSGYDGGKGAITWASGITAVTGVIGSETAGTGNSIFGNDVNDALGSNGVDILYGGGTYNFIVRTPNAFNQALSLSQAGAVTFGTQSGGFANPGALSAANSLVGSQANDHVGNYGYQELGTDLFAVFSPDWNGNKGAISWGHQASSGISGTVGAGNSLLGSTAGSTTTGDRVGSNSLVSFNGGYYTRTAQWSGGAGAISFINTSAPTVGAIDASNSLVGGTAGDSIGSGGIVDFGNKIAVFSSNWDNNGIVDAGAVTWLDPNAPLSGFVGMVSSTNSLVGTSANDRVGSNGYDYAGGNLYAVMSGNWNGNAGAITFFDYTGGASPTGAVSADNSLVGSHANDGVGGASSNFYYGSGYTVITNQTWNGNRGAASWMGTNAPLTGVISSSNSLVGANANDFVGISVTTSSFYLTNGDYIVSSSLNGAGALTVGSKSGGITGVLSDANSLLGFGTSFQRNDGVRLLVRAPTASSGGFSNSGRVCLYAGGAGCASGIPLGSQSYSNNPGSSVTITPSQIVSILNNGTQVVLQANSDITLDALSDIIANNASGNGGALTLSAGRSVLINSNIVTDNGNLTIIANDSTSNGVSAANRDPGTAEITMADGTLLDAGTGSVNIQLRDGAGHAGANDAASNINLRSITAGSLSVKTDFGGIKVGDPDASSASDINIAGDAELIAATKILFAGGRRGAFAQLAAGGQVVVGLPDDQGSPGQPKPVLELRNGGSFARIVSTSLTAVPPIDLQVSDCITCLRLSSGEFIGSGTGILDVITASLLSLNPNLLSQIEVTKRSKGDIEIEGGETCQ